MNSIIINGRRISVSGNNISIINNSVIVDGKVIEDGLSGIVEVKFEGDLANLRVDGSATVNGNVHGHANAGGSLHCRDVRGNASAGGSIHCENVGGSITAGGSVHCRR